MFVSQEKIREMTGKSRYSAQAKWLRERGYKIDQRDDGSVILLEQEIHGKLLSQPLTGRSRPKKDWRPDLSVLDKAG